MESLVTYDTSKKALVSEKVKAPSICSNYICDKHKKCQKFYDKNKDNDDIKNELIKCPYGFYCYFGDENIYTSLLVKELNEQEMRRILKKNNDDISNYDIYKEAQIKRIISDVEKMSDDLNILRDCTHDLRNMGMYFNSMESELKAKFPDLSENDNDFKAMLCMYEMINYRLSYMGKIREADYKIKEMKLHHILEKLRIIMSYKARNKDIKIRLGANEDYIKGFDNLYLAFYILMENAIKYSPPEKEIEIYFQDRGEKVVVGISNYSTQVPTDELDKITIRGYRGKNAVPEGNGIGLSVYYDICKKQKIEYHFASKKINATAYLFIAETTLEKVHVEEN